jgi:uncharacterized membrane protein YbhN (UPF0104 family)
VAFGAALAWFVWSRQDEFKSLWRAPFPASALAPLLPAWALTTVVNSELLRRPMAAYGVNVGFLEGLALTLATSAANYVVPFKGGSGLRALYFRTAHGLGLTEFVSQLFAVGVLSVVTASLFALVGLARLWALGAEPNPLLALYFGGAAALGVASIFLLGRLPVRLPARLAKLAAAWDVFRTSPGLLRNLMGLEVLYFFSWGLLNWLTLAAFQVRLDPGAVFFYAAVQIHSALINVTPAGLGVVEAFSVLAGQLIDASPAQTLSAQALARLTAIVPLSVLGLLSWLHLIKRRRPGGAAADHGRVANRPSQSDL